VAANIRTRVAQIISVLKNTDPEAGMSQAIGELNRVLEEVGVALCRVATEKHLAYSKLAEQNRHHEQLRSEIRTAIQEGSEHVAKAATLRQLHTKTQISLLEQNIAHMEKEEKEMESYLVALRTKKRKMEEMLRQFTSARAAQHIR